MNLRSAVFGTRDAAAYLSEQHGVHASESFLQKARTRGTDDPRDRGPDFWRDARGICWYERAALDRYAASRLAERRFRTRAEQPENFR